MIQNQNDTTMCGIGNSTGTDIHLFNKMTDLIMAADFSSPPEGFLSQPEIKMWMQEYALPALPTGAVGWNNLGDIYQHQAGTLLMVSRSFGSSYSGLPPASVGLIPSDPLTAHQLSMLYGGPMFKHNSSINPDDFRAPKDITSLQPTANMERTRMSNVVILNAFGDIDVVTSDPSVIFDSKKPLSACIDLHFAPSMFNHSCESNVHRFSYGNMMFFYSFVNIKEGEQLFITYTEPTDPLARKKNRLSLLWLPDCHCPLCLIDRAESPRSLAKREELYDYFVSTLEPLASTHDSSTIDLLVQHIDQIEQTYTPGRLICYELRPSLECLSSLYSNLGHHKKAFKTYLKVFKSYGYNLEYKVLPTDATDGADPIHFVQQYPALDGRLFCDYGHMFLILSIKAYRAGYMMFSRKYYNW
eukprot:gene16167-19242_t